jgi:hypothetical protein
MAPLELSAHFWFCPPLQLHSSIFVPLVTWLLYASRHLVTPPMVTRNSCAEVDVHNWSAAKVQSHTSTTAPLVAELPLTSMHRPDAGLTSAVLLRVIAACAFTVKTMAAVATRVLTPTAMAAVRSRSLIGSPARRVVRGW